MATNDDAGVRISDADRQAVVDLLRRHTGDGRLTMPEFEERADRALSARTRGDLSGLLADLPGLPGVVPPAAMWAGAQAAQWPNQPPPPAGAWPGSTPATPPWEQGQTSPRPVWQGPARRHGPGIPTPLVILSLVLLVTLATRAGYFLWWPVWVLAFFWICGRGSWRRHRHRTYL